MAIGARGFQPWFQTSQKRFFAKNFFLFLWTGALLAFTDATIKLFNNLGAFSERKKAAFQGIFGALILLLGLSVFDAFKTLAREAPNFILVHSQYANQTAGDADERKLVYQVEDWFNVGKLAWSASRQRPGKPRKPWVVAACLAWIGLFLATQTAIALTNVAVQTVDGTDFTSTFVDPNVPTAAFPNLTCFFSVDAGNKFYCPMDRDPPGPRDLGTVQYNAHISGLTGSSTAGPLAPPCPEYNDTSEILAMHGVRDDDNFGDYIPLYYCRSARRQQQYAFRFFEYNPKDSAGIYPTFTNRLITASSGPCRHYTNVSDTVEGGFRTYTIKPDNDTATTTLTIATQSEALSGTTFVYDGEAIPPNAVNPERTACGERCIWVWAHLSPPLAAPGPNSFFQCPVTVDEVTNATRDEHKVTRSMARYAAAAIALDGRPRKANGPWQQSRYFSFGTYWSLLEADAGGDVPDSQDLVGAKMAEFAIRSLATMARQNPRPPLPGARPALGSTLEIQRGFTVGIGAAVLLVHLCLFVAIVVVKQAPAPHEPDAAAMAPGAPPEYEMAESQRGLVRARRDEDAWHSGDEYRSGSEDSR